ncbi:RDD family protein [Deltaproteobacteria bacterium TL4]
MALQNCPHCQRPLPLKQNGILGMALKYCPICNLPLKEHTEMGSVHHEQVAPIFARLLARLIDYTLIGILVCLCDWLTGGAFLDGLELMSEGLRDLPQVNFASMLELLLLIGYFIIFHSLSGQTPGKVCCQIIVLKDGDRIPGIISNLLREIGIFLGVVTGGLLFFGLLFSRTHRGIQDFFSRAEVYTQET